MKYVLLVISILFFTVHFMEWGVYKDFLHGGIFFGIISAALFLRASIKKSTGEK